MILKKATIIVAFFNIGKVFGISFCFLKHFRRVQNLLFL